MDTFRFQLVLFLFFLGFNVFADTYNATNSGWMVNGYPYSSTQQGACDNKALGYYALLNTSGSWACWSQNTTAYPSTQMWGVIVAYTCPYGGTLSGTSCINASACPSGQSRNSSGQCVAPCVAGQQQTINVSDLTSTGQLQIVIGSSTATYNGCQYTCSSGGPTSYYAYDSTGKITKHYTPQTCTGTGLVAQSGDSVPATSASTDKSVTNPPNCTTMPTNGSVVCSGGTIPAGCSTVNGVQVCPDPCQAANNCPGATAKDYAQVNNTPVAATDSKNCVYTANSITCVNDPSNVNNAGCVTSASGTYCYSNSPTQTTTQGAPVANPDGSTTKQTVTGDNVKGDRTVTTTQTCQTSGACTTTTQGDPLAASNPKAQADTVVECDKHPDEIGCAKFGDPGTPDTLTNKDVPATFSFSSWGGASSCPADKTYNGMTGVSYVVSWQPACTFASNMAPGVIAIALLSAGAFVLGGVKD